MANHTRSLRTVSFLGNQSIGQPMHRPGNDLVAFDRGVVEIHFLEINFDSMGKIFLTETSLGNHCSTFLP